MPRLKFSIALNYEIDPPGCDFIFSIHAAQTQQQTVVSESLDISQNLTFNTYTDPMTHTRFLRLKAFDGLLTVRYDAIVDVDHYTAQPAQLREVAVANLPGSILSYIYPSRYCQSDRLHRLAVKEFGQLVQGYSRVQAIRDWVLNRVTFLPNSSTGNTSAADTLVEEVGVCRDFAHLMIALCRAVNIPSRFVTGIDYGAAPALGPPDFHAYVEVYLEDRWYIFDPSGVAIPMGFVRLGTGRDAADSAFATLFGGVRGAAPVIQIEAIPNANGELIIPQHVPYALSTDGQFEKN
ncbi:MAG: transglutaminase family protein [Halothiobacillus sp.]|jgi:transglutaminase-like putative cysteine protease|uniref:transglutaminase-like domain-containing protein n=1 Tax=Halothiobacillus sp. TaxID=1891311 RepID=UPI002AD42DAA|nr:transglutaminase family protein [Halothiobacillus sp.]MDA3876564.1 transglutaminase family protein [Halothiobacillus sp.]